MIEELQQIVSGLNTLTPLGLAGLLALIMFYQSKNKTAMTDISDNHLSGLPDMADSLRRIEGLLQNMNDNIVYIRARVNGKDSK